MTPARASQILAARGIEGLVIAPQPEPAATLTLDWARFSAVVIGYSVASPVLHMVCPNQYRSMMLAMDRLRSRDYRRIGLVMLRASDERVDHNWLAGYLVAQQALAARDRLPPLFLEAWDEAAFAAWLHEHRPDALVSKCAEALPALRRLGRRLPRDLGAAFLTRVKASRDLSGVNESPLEVGAAAVDYLAGMLHRNERGVPDHPRRLLIEGKWFDGRTVRALRSTRSRVASPTQPE
jgi:LacI family transcriptional regulator